MLAVVVSHGEVDRFDSVEVWAVELAIQAGLLERRAAQRGFEPIDQRAHQIDLRHAQLGGFGDQAVAKARIDQGVDQQTTLLLRLQYGGIDLAFEAHMALHAELYTRGRAGGDRGWGCLELRQDGIDHLLGAGADPARNDDQVQRLDHSSLIQLAPTAEQPVAEEVEHCADNPRRRHQRASVGAE